MTNLQAVLSDMHNELAKELLRRITSGDAKPADLECARKLLLDNGIEAVPTAESPLMRLAQLPFPEAEVG